MVTRWRGQRDEKGILMTVETEVQRSSFWERVGPYDSRRNKIALAMFSLMLLSYVLNAMDRQVFSVLATDVRETLV